MRKEYKPVIRNRDNIQFADLRNRCYKCGKLVKGEPCSCGGKGLDKKYEELHDELSKAYYQYWREGKSYPFQGYDVFESKEDSKELFDKLHGQIAQLRELEFHKMNQEKPDSKKIPIKEYDDENAHISALEMVRMEKSNNVSVTVDGFEPDDFYESDGNLKAKKLNKLQLIS